MKPNRMIVQRLAGRFTVPSRSKMCVANEVISKRERANTTGSLIAGGFVYAAISLGQKGVPYLLLPLVARAVSPEQLGYIALLTAYTTLLATFLRLGLDTAVFRYFFLIVDDHIRRREVIGTIAIFLLAITFLLPIGTIGIMIVATGLFSGHNALSGHSAEICLAILFVSLSIFPQACAAPLLRAEQRLMPFVAINVVGAAVSIAATLIFVLQWRWGVTGWFAAQSLGALVVLPLSVAYTIHAFKVSFRRRHLATALRYGAPLVPHQLSHWLLNLADRALLPLFVTATLVGIYSAAYQLVALLGLLLTSINQALMPEYARASSSGVIDRRVEEIATGQAILTIVLGACTLLLVPPAIRELLPPEYHAAIPLVPWLTLGYVFFGLYYIPTNTLTLINGDTKWIWLFTSLAGVANVLCNLLLIPNWGIYAAALNTAFSYAVLLLLVSVYTQRRYRMQLALDYRKVGATIALTSVACVIATMSINNDSPAALLLRSLTCCVIAIGVGLVSGFRLPAPFEGRWFGR